MIVKRISEAHITIATIDTTKICPWSIASDSPGLASAQTVDLVGEARVATGVHQLDVGEPAVDVAEFGAHLGGRALRIAAHALPELGVLLGLVEPDRLLRREVAGRQIGKQHPAAGHA